MHGDQNSEAFHASHLDIDFDLPRPVDEMLFPDVYVGLNIDLLAPGDGIVTDRHHASADRYEADDPQNQIAGQISPFTLSGWLRHGCERVVQTAGATACHPGEPNADYMLDDVDDRDLDAGYHEKGSCVDGGDDTGFVIHDLFGGFGDRAGRVIRRPIRFSPIRRHVDVTEGEAEAHYRQLHTQVRSRNAGAGQPLRTAQRDVVGNVEGTWKLTLRTVTPAFVGLLVAAVEYLDAHADDFLFQLGGARNFGAGIPQARMLNPLYSDREIRRVYESAKAKTTAMETKDDCWTALLRPAFLAAFRRRVRADARAMGVSDGGDGSVAAPTGGEGA